MSCLPDGARIICTSRVPLEEGGYTATVYGERYRWADITTRSPFATSKRIALLGCAGA